MTKPWPLLLMAEVEIASRFRERKKNILRRELFILLERSESMTLFLLSPPIHGLFIKGNIYLDMRHWHQFFWFVVSNNEKIQSKTDLCSAMKVRMMDSVSLSVWSVNLSDTLEICKLMLICCTCVKCWGCVFHIKIARAKCHYFVITD